MKFKLEIDCNNAAFQPDAGGMNEEVRRILYGICDRLASGHLDTDTPALLRDFYGNRVGYAEFVEG